MIVVTGSVTAREDTFDEVIGRPGPSAGYARRPGMRNFNSSYCPKLLYYLAHKCGAQWRRMWNAETVLLLALIVGIVACCRLSLHGRMLGLLTIEMALK